MKKQIMIFIIMLVLLVVNLCGCNDNNADTNDDLGDDDGGGTKTTYTSFTNGEFYVEYPSDWDVFTEDTSGAGITTEAYFGAENTEGSGLYIRGHKTPSSTLLDFDGWYESALEDLQNSEDATVLDNELSINEAFIEFTDLKGGAVLVYSKYKFLGCLETAYQCTSSVENILRNKYQDEIDHIISSFSCVN